ncbi:MAG: DUF2500 family protein [Clostridia bacterium]|nr:DUF2500 family protein [Clostridia bacterium]MBQ7789554.1 DUF2500 family protein [Clostridia bacterium]
MPIIILFISIPLVLGVFAVILLFKLFGGAAYSSTKNLLSKKKIVQAEFITKREQLMLRASGPYTNYFATFRLSENDSIEFPIPKRLYKKLKSGHTGTLTYLGNTFYSYKINK